MSFTFETLPERIGHTLDVESGKCVIPVCLSPNNPLLVDEKVCLQIFSEISERAKTIIILICDDLSIHERLISKGK